MSQFRIQAIAAAVLLASAAPALAQSGAAPTQGGHSMAGMDMGAMMNQCTQMRQQMQPGARMAPDMQAMMRRCDEMDRQMGGAAAPSNAPRTRTR